MATIVPAQQTAIANLYTALFNRAPDAAGFGFWVQSLSNGASLASITSAFLTSPESKAIYPSSQTSEQFITTFYTNVFGRAPDAAGLAFWAGVVNANGGSSSDAAKAVAITQIINIVSTPLTTKPADITDAQYAQTVADRGTFINKGIVGVYYAVEAKGTSLDIAKQVLSAVNATDASVTAAKLVADGVAGGGTTFTLTTGVDTISGTNGADSIVGDHLTTSSSDTINGGAGIDSLTITDSSTTGINANPTVNGVEIINIRNVNGSAAVTAVTEVSTVTFNPVTLADGVSSTIILAGQTYTLTGQGGGSTFTAAQIAQVISGGAAVTGITLTSGALTGYTKALGNADQIVYTSSVPGNVTDVLNTGTAVVNSISTVQGVLAVTSTGINDTFVATNFVGATDFNSVNSSSNVTFSALAAGQKVGKVGGSADVTANYAAAVTAGTINISGGSTAGAITETGAGIASNTINSTGDKANTVGVVTLSGTTNKSLTINAAAALTVTSIGGLTAGATITVAGAATATTGVGVTLGTLDSDVTVLNASGLTAGGVSATLNADAAIVVTGGAGNDRITTGAALTTGSVNAGAGTADRLTIANDAHINSLALGNKYSGFEVVGLVAGATQDLSFLATNNTLTGLIVAGSATVTNVNTATAANVTVTGNSTLSLGVVGALNPGQVDTVNLLVNDGVAAVNTITLTTPSLAGVEILTIAATDNVTVTSLANALALTSLTITGAANASVTTTAIALQTNFAVNASASTGNLVFDATGATTNGFSIIGAAGTNTITGGSQVFSANLGASLTKADVITLTNATGGTLSLPNAKISGFTNSATVTVADKLDVIGTATVQADVATAAATGITNLLATSTAGIMTFSGTAAATATLSDKISAAASANFAGTANEVIAFQHDGNTYIVSQQATNDAFNAGSDIVVELTGVTGVTALSTTASGANTIWVV